MRLSLYNTVPDDTRQAALSIYSPSQPYITIGDQDWTHLTEIDFSGLGTALGEPEDIAALLSLVTLFQYAERLSDAQAARATSQRVDWKYALHLPLTFPGIAPNTLCVYRQRVASSQACASTLQVLIEHIASWGLSVNSPHGLAEPWEVIQVNCLKNDVDEAINLFLPVLEVLASEHPAWLKRIAQPHWISRYMAPHRSLFQAFSREELVETLFCLEKDIEHIVKEIQDHSDCHVRHYPEIRSLLDASKLPGLFNCSQSVVSTEFRITCVTCICSRRSNRISDEIINSFSYVDKGGSPIDKTCADISPV